jgi:hypothetical protein
MGWEGYAEDWAAGVECDHSGRTSLTDYPTGAVDLDATEVNPSSLSHPAAWANSDGDADLLTIEWFVAPPQEP